MLTLPLPGIRRFDENENEIEGNQVVGSLVSTMAWNCKRTIWGDHQRYKRHI
jgi:acyl-coenzyme A synthetase/AMP-(fatty) acid ligase